MKQPILIVGGGLGGLITALALAQRGWPVHVLEGAPEFGAIGYGIQFGPNVFHVLERIGVGNEILEKADAPPAVLMIDALTGKEVTRVPTGPSFRGRFKYPYIIIHRIDLHQALLDACRRSGGIELVPDAMVTGFEDDGDLVAATTQDGRKFTGSARADGRGECRCATRHRRLVGRARLPHRALPAAPRHAVQHRGGVPQLHPFG
jgi:salicylate hydroxylase